MLQDKKDLSINGALDKIIENYFKLHEGSLPSSGLYGNVIKEVEKVLISKTLKYTSNNQQQAAVILGINRNTLRKKLQNLLDNAE